MATLYLNQRRNHGTALTAAEADALGVFFTAAMNGKDVRSELTGATLSKTLDAIKKVGLAWEIARQEKEERDVAADARKRTRAEMNLFLDTDPDDERLPDLLKEFSNRTIESLDWDLKHSDGPRSKLVTAEKNRRALDSIGGAMVL